jgi:glycosyltransferase involved in cell wall biosynthesis
MENRLGVIAEMNSQISSTDLLILIPAFNEEDALPDLLIGLRRHITNNIVVIDNDSTDQTAKVAKNCGVTVIKEKQKGYGSACKAGIEYARSLQSQPSFICFFDGDGQSNISDIAKIFTHIRKTDSRYCQGSRMLLSKSRARLSSPAIVANSFFSKLCTFVYKQQLSDIGPLRIISSNLLYNLEMNTKGYGWTIEMTSKILKAGILHSEIPVNYFEREKGKSKISGNRITAIKAAIVMNVIFLRILLFWRPNIEL